MSLKIEGEKNRTLIQYLDRNYHQRLLDKQAEVDRLLIALSNVSLEYVMERHLQNQKPLGILIRHSIFRFLVLDHLRRFISSRYQCDAGSDIGDFDESNQVL